MRSWQWQHCLLTRILLGSTEHGNKEVISTSRWSYVKVVAWLSCCLRCNFCSCCTSACHYILANLVHTGGCIGAALGKDLVMAEPRWYYQLTSNNAPDAMQLDAMQMHQIPCKVQISYFVCFAVGRGK